MSSQFSYIPQAAIDFIRNTFGAANDKVARIMCMQPSTHEEMLDFVLMTELAASPPAYFANERMGISLESHWLGGRRMYERWEIADIAFFILLRRSGKLVARKVVLLQTKRLYSREIPVAQIDRVDYMIGVGRIVDIVESIVPFSSQRNFRFDDECRYGAMSAGSHQIGHIEQYASRQAIPVYYGFYNPLRVPYDAEYPASNGIPVNGENSLGMRVLPSTTVHAVLSSLDEGASPSLKDMQASPLSPDDQLSVHGWRLEKFIADEVLSCREGRLFEETSDPNLRALLYERSAPMQAAIAITIDIADD